MTKAPESPTRDTTTDRRGQSDTRTDRHTHRQADGEADCRFNELIQLTITAVFITVTQVDNYSQLGYIGLIISVRGRTNITLYFMG